jgi:hypothetical protein
LQTALDRDLTLFNFEGTVSVPYKKLFPSAATLKRVIQTGLGGEIDTQPSNRQMTRVSYGTPTTFGATFTHQEVLDDIVASTGLELSSLLIPDVAISRRGIKMGIPKEIEELEALQGKNTLLHQQTAIGNHIHKIRRTFGLWQLQNPYRMIKSELILNGVVSPYDRCFRRMKSVLKTDWVIAPPMGWRGLKTEMLPIHRAMAKNRWWQDIGLPHPLTGQINHTYLDATVYRLDRRKELVAI